MLDYNTWHTCKVGNQKDVTIDIKAEKEYLLEFFSFSDEHRKATSVTYIYFLKD